MTERDYLHDDDIDSESFVRIKRIKPRNTIQDKKAAREFAKSEKKFHKNKSLVHQEESTGMSPVVVFSARHALRSRITEKIPDFLPPHSFSNIADQRQFLKKRYSPNPHK